MHIAAAALLIFFALYLDVASFGWTANEIFLFLANGCLAYAFFAGLILTADCVSAEKREGTLGLLFLTALKSPEMVAGILSATSVKALYGLLAAFPILGLAFLLGGVTFWEFIRVCATLVSAMVFSLSVCLLVSCLSRKRLFAAGRSAIILIFFGIGIPIAVEALRRAFPTPPAWLSILDLFSPVQTLRWAGPFYYLHQSEFAWSLGIVHALSIAALVGSCLALPRVWKDRIHATARKTPEKHRAIRPISENPYLWLTSRHAREGVRFLVGLVVFGAIASIIGHYPIASSRHPAFASQLAAWSFLMVAADGVLLFKFAALATARLAEDREIGALEAILVTPLSVREILRGHRLAILRQLFGPALALLFMHGLHLWALLTLYALDRNVPNGASGCLQAMMEGLRHGEFQPTDLFQITTLACASAGLLILIWIALSCVGMWIGLRSRRPAWIVWITLAVVIAPPIIVFLGINAIAVWLDIARANVQFWIWFSILSGFGLAMTHQIAVTLYACRRLRRDFRATAMARFSRSVQGSLVGWLPWAIRIAAATGAVTLVIVGFYIEERQRGRRAWLAVERDFASRGQILITNWLSQPMIPAEENFGAGELFKPLFAYRYDESGRAVFGSERARRELLSLTVVGDPRSRGGLVEPRHNWALQKSTDLEAWRKFYETNAPFDRCCVTGSISAAQQVLNALSIFSAELEELETLSRRPGCRFPTHDHETHAALWAHLPFLKNVADVTALRASARLACGDVAGARGDIEFNIRLARHAGSGVGLFPLGVRRAILLKTLQPIWEGLNRDAWDDETLVAFQALLQIDLLTLYQGAARQQVAAMADFVERLARPDEPMLTRIGMPLRARAAYLYPAGWKLLNMARLYELGEKTLAPMVDPQKRRVYPIDPAKLAAAIRGAHVRGDLLTGELIPWELEMFRDSIRATAHAQVSLDEAVIACELQRFKKRRGEFPENLALLENLNAKGLLRDPMSGEDFKYKRLKDGYELYSLGWNGRDDGGKIVSKKTAPKAAENDELELTEGDWVWRQTTAAKQEKK